jgi:hypothetical protein
MSKMGSHDPFAYFKHKLWSKEGLKVKFDSQPLKVKNLPDLFTCRWRATYRWKAIDKGYNFALSLTSIKSLHKKLWASKVARIPISKILGLPTWESRDKMTFGCTAVARHKEYYNGEGGGLPQVRFVVSLLSLCLPMVCPCTKNDLTMH